MAMTCVNGGECDGCMQCQEYGEKKMYCPVCNKQLDYESHVYVDKESDEIIGCERCIRIEYAEDYEDVL